MAEETTYVKQSAGERRLEILLASLEKAKANNGILLNSTEKTFPKFLDKNLRINPVNALMMAMHSDLNEGKTNVYTLFNDAKSRGESVKKGQKGVPFTWTNTNEYVSKDKPEDKISRKEYQLLDDKDKDSYKVNPREETNILFNIDQTTMHHVNEEAYNKQVKENGLLSERSEENKVKDIRIDVNQYLFNVKDNLVNIIQDRGGVSYYDIEKDTIHLPYQETFESYPDYVQEAARQIVRATAIPGRLNREGAILESEKVPSVDKRQRELLVEDLSSAHKMLELGMPAKLSPETIKQLPQIIEQLKNDPELSEKVLHDVNRTVGMIKKAENGEKINLIEKPSEAKQLKWAEQFPMDKVPQNFTHIVMTKDDEGKWALVAKPEGERTFAVRPTYQDVSMYFDMIKNDHDEAKTEQFRTQFAQKYYAVLAREPDKEINLFKSNASEEALTLIDKVTAFKGKDDKVYLIATIGEERQQPVALSQNQWNRMFLADDKRDYKAHLAAMVYSDVLKAKLEEQKEGKTQQVDSEEVKAEQKEFDPKEHEEDKECARLLKEIEKIDKQCRAETMPNRQRELFLQKQNLESKLQERIKMLQEGKDVNAKNEEETKKVRNSPEQKEKAKRSEKAKEKATKQETKAVSAIAMSPLLKQFYDLKGKHPDALLLFRTGDFYETYCEDAKKASKILGVTLTKSSKTKDKEGKPLAMAGFPYHALDAYLPKLIRAGQRVAICDQIEQPREMLRQRGSSETVQSQGQEQEQKAGKEESHSRGFHR